MDRKKILNTLGVLFSVGSVALLVIISAQFNVSSQGDPSETYPKGFRGGTCTIETGSFTIGYSAYFIPKDYTVPEDPMSALSVPILCDQVPSSGKLDVTINLLYPRLIRDIPLVLRVIKIEKNHTEREVLSVPAQRYPYGVIAQSLVLRELGEYILYLDGRNSDHASLSIKLPIKVGIDWRDNLTIL